MDRVILATANPAKAATLAKLVAPISFRRLDRIAPLTNEDGPTVAEIAQRKALHVSASAPEAIVVASDGGLEIPSLGSRWSPTRTSRFAGERSPAEKAASLLALLHGYEGAQRRARWIEALAVARNGSILACWTVSGPYARLAATDERNLDDVELWVDALLKEHELGAGHWEQLTELFSEFCRRGGLQ